MNLSAHLARPAAAVLPVASNNGRRADLKALGVAAAGIDGTRSFIAVDDHLRAADGVWSVGDVTGAGAVTHVAMYQARIAASDILGQAHEPASYRALPRLTFTDPEVGAVGLTEAQARGRNVTVRTAVSPIRSSSRGWIHGPGNDGFIKADPRLRRRDAGRSHLRRACRR